MIRFQEISLRRGIKLLLEKATATINPKEKVGLIGPNGAGKTSLFALLNHELYPDHGDVDFPTNWNISYVKQEITDFTKNAIEYVIDGDKPLRHLQAQLAQLEEKNAPTENGVQMAEVLSKLEEAGLYTIYARAGELLLGLGFSKEELDRPISSFSGGWQMRLNLAQALIAPSDLLLLDEPTNHLDLDAIIWLEDWLKRYSGTLIIISHDRDFLDGIANVILHIDEQKLKRYPGNYSDFERQRAAQVTLMQSAIEKQEKKRAHLEAFITRFRYKATKARQAQSRLKMLEKMKALTPLRASAEFSFDFMSPESSPDLLFAMQDLKAGYGSKEVLSHVNFSLRTGERIGLLGVNGAGKSTLIKTIVGELTPLGGQFTPNKNLKIGYFAQQEMDMLRHDESPLWHLTQITPDAKEQDLRNFLGQFLFPGDMATSPIQPFSGGEKARLALALIVWRRPNLLLLDEPTNHLDLETREALTDALSHFDGTLVLVSHDRYLLRATTDKFLIVANGQLKEFEGDLDDYKNWLYQTQLNTKATESKPSVVLNQKEQRRINAENRQKIAALKKPIQDRLLRIEREMEKLQAQKAIIEQKMNDKSIYETQNKEQLKQLLIDQAYCTKELESLEEEWLIKQEELEKITIE